MDLSGQRIHFMGVGGIGMSALAAMALAAGAEVSGCDRTESPLIRELTARGMRFAPGHDPAHIDGGEALVFSSAIPADNPERLAAGSRAENRGSFLAKLFSGRNAVGICGTHGKTTTTWLLAQVLIAAGLDPAVFVGGMTSSLPGGNFRLGGGPFVSELDESDGTFLLPALEMAVVTNIDSDHLSHYGTEAALRDAFRRFAAGVAERGYLVACLDNPGSADLYSAHHGEKLSYGFSTDADLRAREIRERREGTAFSVLCRGANLGQFVIPFAGSHNVLNALAALGAAQRLGVDTETVRKALAGAEGVKRRLERLGELNGAVVYSDYAHHPAEIEATIRALRQKHDGRILAVFQPHLYSRTRDYAEGFAAALAMADMVQLVDIYPAREEPIPGVSSEMLIAPARRINPLINLPVSPTGVEEAVRRLADDFEAVVMMGAGDIDDIARAMVVSGR